jgi:tight adherence protein C
MTPEILAVVAVFIAVGAFTVLAGFAWLERATPERTRLQRLSQRPGTVAAADAGSLVDDTTFNPWLKSVLPKSPKEMGRIRRQLSKAGYHGSAPAVIYAFAELVLPVALGGATYLIVGGGEGWFIVAIAAIVGYMAPSFYIGRKINAYKKEIRNGLADALDLLIVCVEAGSGLDQAIMKATEELAVSYPSLSRELGMITTEVRAGKPRMEAFKNFADRTKVDDVVSLVAVMIQTDRFGTSMAQALRTHADVLRTKRRQRAEEKAAKLGVKLVFPLVLCLFPALYIVTLGPAVVKIMRFFDQQDAQDTSNLQ